MTVSFRLAQARDMLLIHEWANRSDSLAVSLRTSEPIAFERHCAWFTQRLADPQTRILIAEYEGAPAGQVRVQYGAEGPEVSIYVDPARRRGGIALELLAHAAEVASVLWPGSALLARVKPGNVASLALFARAGYRLRECRPDHNLLERRPE